MDYVKTDVAKVLSKHELADGLDKYKELIKMFSTTNEKKKKKFQKLYNGFFKVRQREEKFYNDYYTFMEAHMNDKNISFETVLKHFYSI
jgi:hypothetical protein